MSLPEYVTGSGARRSPSVRPLLVLGVVPTPRLGRTSQAKPVLAGGCTEKSNVPTSELKAKLPSGVTGPVEARGTYTVSPSATCSTSDTIDAGDTTVRASAPERGVV